MADTHYEHRTSICWMATMAIRTPGQDQADIVAQRAEGLGERTGHVGQPTDLGEWNCFGGKEQDVEWLLGHIRLLAGKQVAITNWRACYRVKNGPT